MGEVFSIIGNGAYANGWKSAKPHVDQTIRTSFLLTSNILTTSLSGKPLLLSFVCSEPETTASQSRKRKRSEDQDLKFDDIKLGEVYTVTVKSVKTLQLNVQLSRKVGKFFVVVKKLIF